MDTQVASRILAVDDLPQNLELLQAQLDAQGHCVATASNGADALRKVEKEPPDLILLDVMMSGSTGYEVCRQLKADAETARIPVLILTSLSAPEDMVRAMEAGADDFLCKPFTGVELLLRIRALLRIKTLQDQVETCRRMAVVGELASGIAQEIRNPLAIAGSAAQILLKKGANPQLRQECAVKIRAAANRAAGILENFLRSSRPSCGVRERRGVNRTGLLPAHAVEGLETAGVPA